MHLIFPLQHPRLTTDNLLLVMFSFVERFLPLDLSGLNVTHTFPFPFPCFHLSFEVPVSNVSLSCVPSLPHDIGSCVFSFPKRFHSTTLIVILTKLLFLVIQVVVQVSLK